MQKLSGFALITITLLLISSDIRAQNYAWCGYAMLEGLPVSGSQVSVIEAITPDFNPYGGQPNELFQTRFSLDNSKVIIEACFEVDPTRNLIVLLLDQVLAADLTEIDSSLVYTVFAPGGSRDESEALVTAYIHTNASEWERND